MAFSACYTLATFSAVLSLVYAQAPVDPYEESGNKVGAVFSSVGAVLATSVPDSRGYYSLAQAEQRALENHINEVRTLDFSDLNPQAAVQHAQNRQFYVDGLNSEVQRMYAEAQIAADREALGQQGQGFTNYQPVQPVQPVQQAPPPQAYQGQYARPNGFLAATGAPIFRNKAVMKDESASVTTTETSSAQPTENAKESKSESKESKSERKSESKEAKSESKAESKASKSAHEAAATNGTSSAASTHVADASSNSTTTATSTKKHKHKNNAIATGVSGGALVAGALMALL